MEKKEIIIKKGLEKKEIIIKKGLEKAIHDSYVFNIFIDYLIDKQYHDVPEKTI